MVEEDHLEDIAEVYTRPDSVPVCPSLQGPFQLNPDLDISEDFEISDILVFGLSNVDSIDEEGSPEGLSSSVVCLLTSNCEVHMCLDLEGIEGQWLPTIEVCTIPSNASLSPLIIIQDLESSQERSEDEHTLLVIETVRLLSSTSQDRPVTAHPTFTTDDSTDFSFFVTDELGVFYVSMLGWVTNLERELSGASIDGAEFRLTNFLTSAHSVAESIFPISEEVKGVSSEGVASCVNYDDADLGHFVLTAVQGQPFAATLDARSSRHPSEFRASSAEVEVPDLPIRPSYQQAAIFYKNSKLIAFMDEKVPARYKSSLASEVRLSAATLEIMTHAHRILSHETNQLGLAASDLFSRCERLKLEFKAQILKAAQLADQIDKATGNDEESFDDTTSQDQPPGTAHINQRLEDAKTRQANLVAQADRIRKKLAQTNTRDLTEKEHAWIEEVDKMSRAVNEQRHGRSDEPSAIERLRTVQKIKDEVVAEAKDTETESKKAPNGHAHVAVPSEYRKQKVEHINKLLEREKAMLDAAQNRLEKLGAVV
jgi:nucleoporin NUP82